jgi:hypothetical protein
MKKTASSLPLASLFAAALPAPASAADPDDKALKEGKTYNFAFAVHEHNITTRGHQVSFPVTVGFGAKADIQATKLK